MNVRRANYEAIVDGLWHWCPNGDQESVPRSGVNDISVVVTPSELGHRPVTDHLRLFVTFETGLDKLEVLGAGNRTSYGKLRIGGRQAPAVLVQHHDPELSDVPDSGWFIKAWPGFEGNVSDKPVDQSINVA